MTGVGKIEEPAIAACAAACALFASAAWTWISFSAAIARNAKRCNAIRKPFRGRGTSR
jgi:hypothetical protein